MDFVQYMAKRALGRMARLQSDVRHQSTCHCGRKMVNLYLRADGRGIAIWQCKKCWDAERKEE